ncbi:MAG: DUF3108 domain-containing protein [candidate division Zixibacteria bacterium]|nr:DUF3108 domain-containing protein [candidate division Zixibacteria bacterium]
MINIAVKILTAIALISFMQLAFADDSTWVDTVGIVPDSVEQVIPQPPDSAYIARASDSNWWKRKIENRAFNIGEYLEFSVSYGILPAGTAIMAVVDTIRHNGAKCFKIRSTAHSNGFVSTFYKVRDTVLTYIDYDGIFSHYFYKNLHEGGYKAEKTTNFDQRRHMAITGKDTIPTYSFVQDAYSSFYYVRTQDIEPGSEILIDNHTDKKNYPLKVIVHGRETVKVAAGEFDCIVVEPVMRAEGIFKAKGSIKIWLTDDEYKLPVKMQTEVFFLGSIHVKLKKFKYGAFPDEQMIGADNDR